MADPALAIYTFGLFLHPADDAANDGFHRRGDPLFAEAEAARGFIARSGYDGDPGPDGWGEETWPRFFTDTHQDGWAPATLSLWQDLESLHAFAYSGLHAEALARGRDWIVKPAWPPYVLWWHHGPGRPTWAEAVRRHHALADHGAAPEAFDFAAPFDPGGRSCRIDRARARAIAEERLGGAGPTRPRAPRSPA